jgi:hypothetical protein
MKNANILTVGDLVQFTEEELIHARFMRKTVNEIKEIIGSMGLHLGTQVAGSQHSQAVTPRAPEIGFRESVEADVIILLDNLAGLTALLQPRIDYLLSDAFAGVVSFVGALTLSVLADD